MRVLKFGGTSVGSIQNIKQVVSIANQRANNTKTIVVVSALGGVTDLLVTAGTMAAIKNTDYQKIFVQIKEKHILFAHEFSKETSEIRAQIASLMDELDQLLQGIFLINELSAKTMDELTAFGELASSLIVTAAFKNSGTPVLRKDSRELIITNDLFTKAQVDYSETYTNIENYISKIETNLIVLPGFIARASSGETTTLGRGGSDFSASIVAAALQADCLEIWTDVAGMYTANPKLVKEAQPIKHLSYREAMELSHFGAKVIYPPTIAPVMQKDIPIYIKNTLDPSHNGTSISNAVSDDNNPIKGLSHIPNIALLTLEGAGMIGVPGFSKRFFEVLSIRAINVIFITQASSEHSICIGVLQEDALLAETSVNSEFENEIQLHKLHPLIVEKHLAIIALVGDKMKSHQGISGKMFHVLGKNNVNVRAIAQGASEKNISAVVAEKDAVKALNSLHERFFEEQKKQINLFLAGVGNVGGRLIAQIEKQKAYLKEHLNLEIRIVGLSNSRTMVVDPEGISLGNWSDSLAEGDKADIDGFCNHIISLNKRNSVFVDITASEAVALSYHKFLTHNIAVVACNKVASASSLQYYHELKFLSRKYNTPFLFETNVGAGLPVIETLQNLVASGDRIVRIEAVLSGSLNYIFNHFKSRDSFHDIVQLAKSEGYTEPDPRIDLSGIDVARKILILARESQYSLELSDVTIAPFLTQNNLKSKDIPHFFKTLNEDGPHFQQLVQNAAAKNCRLKYVATLEHGKASVGLQEIAEGHPFYDLEGKDNIVLYYTERYNEQPLQVKGAGAGGEVTASGLFADIIKLRKF